MPKSPAAHRIDAGAAGDRIGEIVAGDGVVAGSTDQGVCVVAAGDGIVARAAVDAGGDGVVAAAGDRVLAAAQINGGVGRIGDGDDVLAIIVLVDGLDAAEGYRIAAGTEIYRVAAAAAGHRFDANDGDVVGAVCEIEDIGAARQIDGLAAREGAVECDGVIAGGPGDALDEADRAVRRGHPVVVRNGTGSAARNLVGGRRPRSLVEAPVADQVGFGAVQDLVEVLVDLGGGAGVVPESDLGDLAVEPLAVAAALADEDLVAVDGRALGL